ncbi:hypothetical protein FXO38_20836 [Capsicum annuum]|nr:hypothetical protein FXO38_20836 [Capsicum annuum]KAF3666126.1 hypothetical protein FXO37_10721 [Capsicum annuum]
MRHNRDGPLEFDEWEIECLRDAPPSRSPTVFNCFNQQFCLHFEVFNLGLAPVYIAFIHFMGDDDDAIRFRYSLEVGGFGRKLTWQGVPRSIHDSHKAVRESLDGLIIHRSMALFFSGGDMN